MKFLKKWLPLIILFVMLVIIAALVLVGLKSINNYKNTIANQEQAITAMQNEIDNTIGPMIDCYVVKESVRVGDPITEDLLEYVSIPEKIAYSQTVTEVTNEDGTVTENVERSINVIESFNEVDGKYFRVGMSEGTVLLSDYVMEQQLDNTARYYEMTVNRFPSDIKANDYVDIRIQFTYGEDFIALSHRKVESVNLDTGLFTFVFSENDIAIYNSMLLDSAMYPGVTVYMLKYVDTSAQTAAESYYPINNNVSEILKVNPNIITAVQQEMTLERQQLNALLGGDIETFDSEQLEDVRGYLEDIRDDLAKDQTSTLHDRIQAEEAAAKAAAKNK